MTNEERGGTVPQMQRVMRFRTAFLVVLLSVTLAVGGFVSASSGADAHTYYTCEGTTIGGGGYVSRWQDTVGGWTHYRAATFWTSQSRYYYVYGCP